MLLIERKQHLKEASRILFKQKQKQKVNVYKDKVLQIKEERLRISRKCGCIE
jgi:hypothetical protein